MDNLHKFLLFFKCLTTFYILKIVRKNLAKSGVGGLSYQHLLIILLKKWSKVVDFIFLVYYNQLEIKKE